MKRYGMRACFVFSVAMALVGCQEAKLDRIMEGGPAASAPSNETAPSQEKLVTALKMDLSARANVPVETIDLAEIQPASWADSSLGCPQPGMVYLPALTNGYRVILRVAQSTYTYRAVNETTFVLVSEGCE